MTGLGLAAALPFNQTKGDPLLSLGPVFAIRAKDSIPGEQWALNVGTGGQILRARYGSVGRAEIRRGIGAIFPGTTTNYISVPDAANLRLTQDIDIAVRYTLESLAPATWQSLACRWNGGADRSFQFAISSGGSGLLAFQRTGDGTTVDSLTSTNTLTANGLVIGNTYWFRARTSGTTLTFEWAPDSEEKPTSWTAFGGTRPLAASSFWAGTAPFWVGVNTSVTNDPLSGVVKRVVYGSYNGSTVLDINFANQPDLTTSFTCTTGQTVTVTAVNAVDSADPTLLTAGENYVYLPGTASNTVTTTHAANQNPSGNLNFSARVMMYDWTPSASSLIYHKHNGSSTGFYVQVLTDGRLLFVWGDGVGTVIWATNAAMPFTNGVWYWINITLNLSTGIPTFSWALDSRSEPSSWTNVASSYFSGTAGTTTIAADTVTGPQFGAANGEMALKRIIVRGGSTTNVDVDFTQNTDQSSFVCATGHTITISRASSGRKTVVVTKPVWLLGTDDYLEVSDNDLLDIGSTDSVTILFVFRNWLPVTGSIPISKATTNSTSAAEKRWTFRYTTVNNLGFILDDGTAVASQWLTSTDGTLTVAAASIDLSNVYNKVGVNYSTTARTPSDARNSLIMRIGTNSGGIAYFDGEIYAVYIFRQALTAAQIAAGVQYWNAA